MFTDLLWIASLAFRWRIVSFQKCPRVQKCPKSIIKTNILLHLGFFLKSHPRPFIITPPIYKIFLKPPPTITPLHYN